MNIRVNGEIHSVDVDENTPLLWVLRDVLGLTGTKYGCGIEQCGACTVLLNGEAKRSCVIDVKEAVEKEVTTIEALSPDPEVPAHPLQKAWIEHQVPQCGYCQSGMLMAAAGQMISEHRSGPEIAKEIDNICACGTYQRIKQALKSL